ncbi:MAG TPA: hypothetical protein VD948_09380 [Rhodothermales bacterium]|nr:hypothetical protein [Rhodothermales bacterium]
MQTPMRFPTRTLLAGPILVLLLVPSLAAQPAECAFARADAEAPRLVLPREADEYLRAHAAEPFVQAYLIGLATEVLPEGDPVRRQARAFACEGAAAPGPGELLAALRTHAARSAEPRTSEQLLVRTNLLLDDLRTLPDDPVTWLMRTRGALRDVLDPLVRPPHEPGAPPGDAVQGARRVLAQADRLDAARRAADALTPEEAQTRRALLDARTRFQALEAPPHPAPDTLTAADSLQIANHEARRAAAVADTAQAAAAHLQVAAQRQAALTAATRLTDSLRTGVPRLRADLAVLAQWLGRTTRTFVRDSVAVPVPTPLSVPSAPRVQQVPAPAPLTATPPAQPPSTPGRSSGNLVLDVLVGAGQLVWSGVRQRAVQEATQRLSRTLLGDDLQERLLPATRRFVAVRTNVDAAESLRRALTDDFLSLPANLLGDTLTARLAFERAHLAACPRPRRGRPVRAGCEPAALSAAFRTRLLPVVAEAQPLFRAVAELTANDDPDRVSRIFEAAPLFVGDARWAGPAAPSVQAAARLLSGIAFERRLQGNAALRGTPYVLDPASFSRSGSLARPAYLRLLIGNSAVAGLDARGWAEVTAEVGQTLALVDSSVSGCRRDRLCYFRSGLRVLGSVAALAEVLTPDAQATDLRQARLRWRRLVDVHEQLTHREFTAATSTLLQAFGQAGMPGSRSTLPPTLEARLMTLARIAEADSRSEVERLLADRVLEQVDRAIGR